MPLYIKARDIFVGTSGLYFKIVESVAITLIILFSTCLVFSLHKFALYASPSLSEINQTRFLLKNNNSAADPSVLRWSLSPTSNSTAKSESPGDSKPDLQAVTGQYQSHHPHRGNEMNLGTSDYHADNTNSISLAQKIMKKVKEKFKAGDVPFP